jgi:glycosyltransferase involved in cell wall biosynthesis
MSITEAAACGTPAVVSNIAGHRDALEPGVTGFLGAMNHDIAGRLDELLSDDAIRLRMGAAAAARAARFTWDATARGVLEVLAGEMRRVGPR